MGSNKSHAKKPWLQVASPEDDDNDTITNELCEALKQVNELSDAVYSGANVEIRDVLRQKKVLEDKLKQSHQQIEEMKLVIDAEKRRNTSCECDVLKSKLSDCEIKLTTLQNDVIVLTSEKNDMAKVITTLKEKNEEAEADRDELCKKNVEYEEMLDRTMSDLQTVSEVNEDLAATLEEVSSEKEEALAKIKELVTERSSNSHNFYDDKVVINNLRLQSVPNNSGNKNGRNSSEIKLLLSENERLEKELKVIAYERSNAFEKVEHMSKVMDERERSFKMHLKNLEKQNAALTEKLNGLSTEKAQSAQGPAEFLTSEKLTLLQEISKLETEKTAIEKELLAVQSSRSNNSQDGSLILSEKNMIERKFAAAKIENEGLKSEVKDAKRREELAQRNVKFVLKGKEDMEEKLKELESSKNELMVHIENLTSRNNILASSITELETTNNKLAKEIAEFSTFARERDDLLTKNKNLLAAIDVSSSEKAEAQRSLGAISNSLASAQSEIKILKSQKRAIEDKLQDEKKRIHQLEQQVANGIQKGNEASKLITKLKEDIEKSNGQLRKVKDEKCNLERLLFKSTIENEALCCEIEESNRKQKDMSSKLDVVLSKHQSAISIIEEYDKQTNELHTNISELKLLNKELHFEQEKLIHDLSVTASELEKLKNRKRQIFPEGLLRRPRRVQDSTKHASERSKDISKRIKQSVRTISNKIVSGGRKGIQISSLQLNRLKKASSEKIDDSMKRVGHLTKRLRDISDKEIDETGQVQNSNKIPFFRRNYSRNESHDEPLWPTTLSPKPQFSSFDSFSQGPQDVDLGLLPSMSC